MLARPVPSPGQYHWSQDGVALAGTGSVCTVSVVEDVEVGANLRRIRESLRLSQADVAEAVKASGWTGAYPQTILKVEKGQRALRFTEAVAVARALGFSIESLVRPEGIEGLDRAKLAQLQRKFRQALSDVRELELHSRDNVARLKEARDALRAARQAFLQKYPGTLLDFLEDEPAVHPDAADPLTGPEWDKHPRLREDLRSARQPETPSQT